jgi:hypothetical protein
MKQVLREVKLSIPFRTICFQCRKDLNFDDQKYTDPSIREKYYRYYCEECKNQTRARRIS